MSPRNFVKYTNGSEERRFHLLKTTYQPVYAVDWYTENGDFYAIGLDRRGQLVKLKMKDVRPALYVWVVDFDIAKNILVNVLPENSELEKVNSTGSFHNNYVTVFDSITSPHRYGKNWMLCKVQTKTFEETKKLYHVLCGSSSLLYHVSVLGQWNLSTFLTVEMNVRKGDFVYCVGIDQNFRQVADIPKPSLPVVVFDIETVSNYDQRVPMGNFVADHIMSVTVVIDDTLHTIFNVPVEDEEEEEILKVKTYLKLVDSSDYYKVKHRFAHVVTDEVSLLTKMFEILNTIEGAYICLGYNSRGYDMPYLLNRCVYLNMPQAKNFLYLNGILIYGLNMLHFDLNQIVIKYLAHELGNYSLKNVAQKLLDKDIQKVDFNARNLRYIYKYINERNHVNNGRFDNVMCNQHHDAWEVDFKTLAKYNEMDCLVVLALWDKLQYWDFLRYTSKLFFLPLTRTTLSKLNEYLSGNMIFMGLKNATVFSRHHDQQSVINDTMIMSLDMARVVSSSEEQEAEGSYGGGFNYRKGKASYSTVHAMDAQAYYPSMISGLNISHETCGMIRVGDFNVICSTSSSSFHPENYMFITFCNHKSGIVKNVSTSSSSLAKVESAIVPFAYVSGVLENCKFCTFEEVRTMDPEQKIVVINTNKRGIVSSIIEARNHLRDIARVTRKTIMNYLKKLKTVRTTLCEQGGGDGVMNVNELRRVRSETQNEDEFVVQLHLDLIDVSKFKTFKNPLQTFDMYQEHVNAEFVRLDSHYRNMKLLNNSIYGLLGSSYGTMKGKNNAAIVTMCGRKFIIDAAKIGNTINGRNVYSDTDSVFFDLSDAIVNDPATFIVDNVAKLHNCVKLNVDIYKDVFIVGRKTYIATGEDGAVFSRGINRNGPWLWKYMMDKLYYRFIVEKCEMNSEGVFDLMKEIYHETFEKVREDKTLVLKSINVQDREAYKKDIPVTKLMDRISKTYPTYTFPKKIQCFFRICGDVSEIHYALDFELPHTHVSKINIFKFYNNMFMTFFNLISYAIERTAFARYGVVIKYSSNTFKKVNKIAYIDTINELRNSR